MSTRNEILSFLKTEGPQNSQQLAERLGITPMAVKLQLYDLESEGVVSSEAGPRSRGRPSKLWSLTEQSQSLFPDSHAALSRDILVGIRRQLGESALNQVLDARADEQLRRYRAEITPLEGLAAKLEKLAELRSQEGYMAVVEVRDGQYYLVENHCPVCSAARECLKLCSGELETFQKLLEPEHTIERTEHIIAGARRCAYRVN